MGFQRQTQVLHYKANIFAFLYNCLSLTFLGFNPLPIRARTHWKICPSLACLLFLISWFVPNLAHVLIGYISLSRHLLLSRSLDPLLNGAPWVQIREVFFFKFTDARRWVLEHLNAENNTDASGFVPRRFASRASRSSGMRIRLLGRLSTQNNSEA
jgi:hypothetical protein